MQRATAKYSLAVTKQSSNMEKSSPSNIKALQDKNFLEPAFYFDEKNYQRDSGLGTSVSSAYPQTPPLSSSNAASLYSPALSSASFSHLELPVLSLNQSFTNRKEQSDDHKEGTEKKARKAIRIAFQKNSKLMKDYKVKILLGWGGNGSVLGASRLSDNKNVAIKIIYKKETDAGSVVKNYEKLPNEIKILRQLSNPNILNFLEWFEDAGAFYLVTDRVLSHWNDETGSISGSFDDSIKEDDECMVIRTPTPPHFIRIAIRSGISDLFSFIDCQHTVPNKFRSAIFSKIASGIYYLHSRGFTHGDIKEENVLISSNYSPKICDFGHSKRRKPVTNTTNSFNRMAFYGTKDMTPPELLPNLKKRRTSSSLQNHRFF